MGLADPLFTKVQQRVLGVLFGHPERSFFANEVIALADSGIGAVQREMVRLAFVGLITVKPVGRQKHYQANPDSPVFNELCGIVQKTFGLAEPLRAALAPLAAQISAAFVFGSVAKHSDTASSDIDILILSDTLEYPDVIQALQVAEPGLGRTISATLFTPKDWREKRKSGNSFVERVASQPKIFLTGTEADLE